MRGNVKRLSGPPHPDRERQFQYIQQQRQVFVESGCPILSVDAKKKEWIGNFKNPGRRWVRQPDEVNTHDFPQDALCKATPYGLYDVQRKKGLVCVGTSSDTAEFAVDGVDTWMPSDATLAEALLTKYLISPVVGPSERTAPHPRTAKRRSPVLHASSTASSEVPQDSVMPPPPWP